MTQDEALALLKTGASIFLTGQPGSGKTHTVNRYLRDLAQAGVDVAYTASTGIAATHGHGVTIHAWSGIGVREALTRRDLDVLASNRRLAARIDRLAERVAEKFQTQTVQHTIRTSFPTDLPPVYADEGRLEQVLANLLSNAIKYSPDGGTVVIAGEMAEGRLQVAVSDEGIGMAAEQQERVFERFYRVDNALSRETQGAGLGLYIVRSIVEAHGGTVWLESEPGEGSKFYFNLKLNMNNKSCV